MPALFRYLEDNPRVADRIALQTSPPDEHGHAAWMYWERWPTDWQRRTAVFYELLVRGRSLPVPDEPDILRRSEKQAKRISSVDETHVYRTPAVARDVYFAHVAHVAYLDTGGRLPWRIGDNSDHELRYLLSSANLFTMLETLDGEELYTTKRSNLSDASPAIIGNPRVAYRFMTSNPEVGNLLGSDPLETLGNLSAWMADYLFHNPGGFDLRAYSRDHPFLGNRLVRVHLVVRGVRKHVYLSPFGCWTASDLLADLARSVNIPIRKVANRMENVQQTAFNRHCGVLYNWQGGGGRYLMHTDTLYTEGLNFIPTKLGQSKGPRMMDHIWLDPGAYGQVASYGGADGAFSESSKEQWELYKERARHLLPVKGVLDLATRPKEDYLRWATAAGLSYTEADANYDRLEAILREYGNGDKERGREQLDRLYEQWCERTGKIM